MSKKRDKSTKGSRDKKHCKSKNVNGKKWEPSLGYYKKYEARRRGEGHVTKLRIKTLVALLFEIYSPVTPGEIRMIPYMACLAEREFRCHSYRQHVSCPQTHQGTLPMYGLKTVPSKSCLYHAIAIMLFVNKSTVSYFYHMLWSGVKNVPIPHERLQEKSLLLQIRKSIHINKNNVLLVRPAQVF